MFSPELETDGPFRDPGPGLAARLEQERERYLEAVDRLPRVLLNTYGAYVSRRYAGLAASLLGATMFLVAIGNFVTEQVTRALPTPVLGAASYYLAAAWCLVPVIYVSLRLGAPRWLRRRLVAASRPTGDHAIDIARMTRGPTPAVVERMLDQFAGLRWPLIGACLLLPLTLHAAFALSMSSFQLGLDEFEHWITLSAFLVGHAHLLVAVRANRLARELTNGAEPPATATKRGWNALFAATILSLMPGLALLGIPSLLVFTTGLFIPPAFALAKRRVDHDRRIMLDALRATGR